MERNEQIQIQVDEKKVQRILRKILIAEGRNLSSNEKNDTQMIKWIQKTIKEEVECY